MTEKVQAGRRVLLYTQYTGTLDTMPRWKQVLERYVKGPRPLKVRLLYADTVKPIDREHWLREQVAAGIDVLICNPKLVQVGLDLIDFPPIAYESIPSSTPDFRQSLQGKTVVLIGLGNSTAEMLVQFHRYPDAGLDLRVKVLTHYPREAIRYPRAYHTANGKDYRLFREPFALFKSFSNRSNAC